MLGNIIGFMFIVGLLVFTFVIINDGLDEMMAGCTGTNITTTGCELISDGSPFKFILTNKLILFMMIVVPLWIMFGRSILRMFRGFLYDIGELFESYPSKDNDNEKKKYLKEAKSKLKKELNRKSSENIDTKSEENKGVQWGSGVDLGEGINTYGNK